MNFVKKRDIGPYYDRLFSWGSLGKFLAAHDVDSGVHSIKLGNLPLDFELGLNTGPHLLVFFHGAITANLDRRLPWFTGQGISKGLNASTLHISDPSLYLGDGIVSGWYLGNKHQTDLQQNLVQIVEKCRLSAGASQVVFFGGSGGGFASLYYSAQFPLSTAIAFNPQTNLHRHSYKNLRPYLKVGWSKSRLVDLPATVQVNLDDVYKGSFNNRVFYIQNRSDHHYDIHLRPFVSNIGIGEMYLKIHDLALAHTPPPKEFLRSVLESVLLRPFNGNIEGFSSVH
ncbi:hypothetical protein M0E87_08765 [Corynebacterium sp. CCM 9185]|uniref:Alpha/beta hydrolase family protein n=1 Tax=Corynebacterium marambiense TaxID=2765364 RepID=A0ABS0VWQ1_9CORY|nr:hypothetical protein [Corynebacterium marambiense]MBI9001187.1 hypothetical protein [Corynebacterium marambiense]MCK7663747.1 hypothetical protein [Corynebacterium marambiense]